MHPFQEDALTCGYLVNSGDEVYELTHVRNVRRFFGFDITLALPSPDISCRS